MDLDRKIWRDTMYKSGFVAVVGRPNVGKSTLLNQVLKQKISIISDKPQTTRNKITMIYSSEEGQIVFLDTPGIQAPRNKLGEYMLNTSFSSLEGVDAITMLVDTSTYIGPKDEMAIEELRKYKGKLPIILLINKIDLVKKEDILPVIEKYNSYDLFDEIVPISAMEGTNVEEYIKIVFENLEEGPQYFPEDMITDQPEKFVVAEIIREKGLEFLKEEVPHGLAIRIESMKEREDRPFFDIEAMIYVERDSHKAIVIGKGASMLKKIGTAARKDIESLLGARVNLQIRVKVSKNWREKDEKVAHFGYQ